MNVVLTLLLVAVGAACALTALLAARLRAFPRAAWLGLSAAVGSLVALPDAAPPGIASPTVLDAAVLAVLCLVVAVLLIALLLPSPACVWPVGSALLGVAALIAADTVLWVLVPFPTHALPEPTVPHLALAVTWTGLALATTVRSECRRDRALRLVAIGTGLAGAVDTVVAVVPHDGDDPWVLLVRLAAAGVALSGAVTLAHRAVSRIESIRETQEEELRLAALQAEQTAERDHELRNGLAGIAGATRLLAHEGADRERLDGLVASELHRLDDLLQASVRTPEEPSTTSYAVVPVLQGLVLLRGASGTDVRLEADGGLRAVGSPATLAQVVTNLLHNVERHAPGSPVRITAMQWDGRVVVRIRDFGPGVPPGRETAVFEPGVRDERRGGRGLGLHVCRRMLHAEHGSITVRRAQRARPGCAVVVELAEPTASSRAPARPERASVACVVP